MKAGFRALIKTFYKLTKPGIIYGNLVTAAAGFFAASRSGLDFSLLLKTMLGIALVIASACVFNNLIDRKIDSKMTRTQKRALVTGRIKIPQAVLFGLILGAFGFLILLTFANGLTFIVGAVGYLDYIIFYGIAKRKSVHGTLVGSVSGAAPILAGYTAVSNRIDGIALLLFLILVCWQMVHFYSIAINRLNDYEAAGLPVLPAVKGIKFAKVEISIYLLSFVVGCLLLGFLGFGGKIYLAVVGLLGLYWLILGLGGFRTMNDARWARKMFLFSLVAITIFSAVLCLTPLLT